MVLSVWVLCDKAQLYLMLYQQTNSIPHISHKALLAQFK